MKTKMMRTMNDTEPHLLSEGEDDDDTEGLDDAVVRAKSCGKHAERAEFADATRGVPEKKHLDNQNGEENSDVPESQGLQRFVSGGKKKATESFPKKWPADEDKMKSQFDMKKDHFGSKTARNNQKEVLSKRADK